MTSDITQRPLTTGLDMGRSSPLYKLGDLVQIKKMPMSDSRQQHIRVSMGLHATVGKANWVP